jgi:hypothetical protein
VCDVLLSGEEQCRAGSDVTGSPLPTTFSASALNPGTNFTVYVQALNALGGSANVSAGRVTTHDVPLQCMPPAARTPALAGLPLATTLHVVWHAPFDNGLAILEYQLSIINLATSATTSAIVPHVGGANEFTLTGLSPGSTHSFAVAARNSLGLGPFSAASQLTTAQDVPGTPPAPLLVSESSTSINIRLQTAPYDGGSAILHYIAQVLGVSNSSSSSSSSDVTVSPSILTFTIDPREPFATYQIRVAAVNSNGQSAFSEPLLVYPASGDFPNAPLGLSTASVTTRSFVLSWSMADNARTRSVTQYVLAVTSGSTELVIINGLANIDCIAGCFKTIDATLVNLQPGTTYLMSLRAVNTYGQSVPSAALNVTTLPDVPEPVGSPQVFGVDSTSLSVNWTTPGS